MSKIDDAIKHAETVSSGCSGCSEDHAKLAEWLRELKGFRELFGGMPDYSGLQTPEEEGEVLRVQITTSDGNIRSVLLKNAHYRQDRPDEIDSATGLALAQGDVHFTLAGTLVEGR